MRKYALSPYIKDISDKNSCLFLWSTVPFLQEAFKVMESWGFKYKTMITWRKIMSLGMGYWYRGQTEHLLFGIKGKVPAFRYQKANFYESKSEKHSKKPDYFRELIELSSNKFGNNRIELFARQQNTGWTCLGNEIDGKDINVALKELIGENND